MKSSSNAGAARFLCLSGMMMQHHSGPLTVTMATRVLALPSSVICYTKKHRTALAVGVWPLSGALGPTHRRLL